jgi:hypothetical protein
MVGAIDHVAHEGLVVSIIVLLHITGHHTLVPQADGQENELLQT